MPYVIIRSGDKYKLRNAETGRVLKKQFRTRDEAVASSKSYMKNKAKGKKDKKSKSGDKKSGYSR